ncbi:MAG: hypothetical protein NTW28_20095, partial [Candidatus Solibacter sp.]|nr:hypothetical protein [Candidatus Solibacter sp.]
MPAVEISSETALVSNLAVLLTLNTSQRNCKECFSLYGMVNRFIRAASMLIRPSPRRGLRLPISPGMTYWKASRPCCGLGNILGPPFPAMDGAFLVVPMAKVFWFQLAHTLLFQ